ncbi:MAG: N-acetylmuramoyl-L-alanine amidase [Thermoflavifilum sp.]|nr:N-acetylmuramoyl-L-alanine amidase [Thermoflavifilum sp.]
MHPRSLIWFFAVAEILLSMPAAHAQHPFIHLQQPSRTSLVVHDSIQYISGATCKNCRLMVQDSFVHVYPTGGFAAKIYLHPGNNVVKLTAYYPHGENHTLELSYEYIPPQPWVVNNFTIARIETDPAQTCWLRPGDVIHIRVVAQAGCKAYWIHHLPLTETTPLGDTLAGIYEGNYVVAPDDVLNGPLTVTLQNERGETISAQTDNEFFIWPSTPVVGVTTGERPFMQYSLGEDRLGAAKRAYLDTAIYMLVDGRFGDFYRVLLAPEQHAYVPTEYLKLLPSSTTLPHAIMGNWKVWGDSVYDYVQVDVGARLPYQVNLLDHPGRIEVTLFGAASNTNWIMQYLTTKEINQVRLETLSDGVVCIHIELRHPNPWGCSLSYHGQQLLIRVKRQPSELNLSHLRIAIDAGHGGSNTGATGPTGTREKDLTLLLASQLNTALQRLGAQTFMTRTNDTTLSMLDREKMLWQVQPDLLISIHLNASGNPIDVSGTSTYYHYAGFRPLSLAIYRQLVATGLHEFGNVGNFNFALNGLTEFPNALVEIAFLSNPADEAQLLNPGFQKKIIHAIVDGIKDFLAACKK